MVERQMAEYLDDGRAEWQNCGGMTELQKWRDGGIAEMAGWAEWAEQRNGGMAERMAEWRNGRKNGRMAEIG